jgi:hypothetical protein
MTKNSFKEKKEKMNKHFKHIEKVVDALGRGIDKGLEKPLKTINKNKYLYTIGSCSGHDGSPYVQAVFKDLKFARKYAKELKKKGYKVNTYNYGGETYFYANIAHTHYYKTTSTNLFKDYEAAEKYKQKQKNRKYKIKKTVDKINRIIYYLEVPSSTSHNSKFKFKNIQFAREYKQKLEHWNYEINTTSDDYYKHHGIRYFINLPAPRAETYKPATAEQSKKFWKDVTKILSNEKIAKNLRYKE